jgi:hypothetical protein
MAKLIVVHYGTHVEPTAFTGVNSLLKFLEGANKTLKFKHIKTVEGDFEYSPDHIKSLVRNCYMIKRSFIGSIDDHVNLFVVETV